MKLSLGYQVLLAIGLGIVVGLIFGPYCSILNPVSEIFLMLLQMVILPYLLFLLIHGLGSMSADIAKKLLRKGWIFLVVLWGACFAVVYSLLLLIPSPQLIFVQPTSSGAQSVTENILAYLIPKNIFYDLTNNIVPAITICGLIAGLALMSIQKKDNVLSLLSQVNVSIEKILEWLAKASPIPIFCHFAFAVGTMHLGDLLKVEFCIAIYIIGTLFLTFWFLPALLTSLTDLTYREVMREFKNVCLVPFATGMPSLAFPFFYQAIKRFAQRNEMDSKHFENTAQTVLPLSFTFGQVGNFFLLIFIFFLSFYTHHPMTSVQEMLIKILILPMSFGTIFSNITSISFLIDKFHFPPEAYQVFMITSSVTMNFQVLLSIASVFTLVILVLSAYYGLLKVKWGQLARRLGLAFFVFAVMIVCFKPLLKFQDNFTYLYQSLRVSEVIPSPQNAKVYQLGESIPPRGGLNLTPMERVLKTGVLRIGYFPFDTPFSYMNRFGEIAGYDISFAYQLAIDLDVNLEFIPLDVGRIGEQLSNGDFDIAMSGLVMTEDRLVKMQFVKPTFEQNNVLIVPLSNKKQFFSLQEVQSIQGLKIGGIGAYYEAILRHFPLSQPVPIQNFQSLLDGKVDAVIWTYLSAFVWCLSHPEFTIVDYGDRLGKHFFSYAVREGADDWMHFLQNWLVLKDQSNFSSDMYTYWILGQKIEKHPAHWSLLQYMKNLFSTSPEELK